MKITLHQFVIGTLCFLTLGLILLWIRSYFVGEAFRWADTRDSDSEYFQTLTELRTGAGGIGFMRIRIGTTDPERVPRMRIRGEERLKAFRAGYTRADEPYYPPRVGGSDAPFAAIGLHYTFDSRTGRSIRIWNKAITAPWWLLIMAAAAYPLGRYVMRIVRQQQEERQALGRCPRCDCDLLGRDKCPSCGKTIPADSQFLPA